MVTQQVTLDVTKVSSGTQWIRMGQSDSGGTTIEARVYDDGEALSLNGATAVFCMRLPGGMYYVRDETCTVSGNTIAYLVNEEYCCTVAGQTDIAYFEIHVGNRILSTSRFKVEVKRAAASGRAVHSFDNDIQQLISELVDNMGDRIDGTIGQMASGYLPLTEQEVIALTPLGDLVDLDNERY